MNVRFFPRQYHAAHAHQPPNFHLPYAAPYGSPNFLAAAAKPQQGEFSHSAPSNYRSAQVYPSPIQSFSLPPCCALAYTYPQGLAPQGYSRPAYDRDFTERSSGYVRKDSIWSSSPFVSYSGIRQQVARRFVDFRQARRKSQRVKFNSRRFRMSSSTALLPKDRKKPADDHPIFLRVCHSPWIAIGQNALVALRGITAAYLLVSFAMIIHYDLKFNEHGWLSAFELGSISYLLQALYAWIALLWTWMHLNYPHHANQITTGTTRIQSMLSPPRQNPTTKNRCFFSIFYTATVTYPFVVTFIHWAILIPKHETTIPGDEIFTKGWYTQFFVLNKFCINSVISLIEIFIYSSIRRQDPFGAHMLGLAILSLLYYGWTNVGYVVCDKYAYYFFDHHKSGWKDVGIAIAGFVILTNIWFAFVYGLTGIREKLTKRSEDKSYGYARLPQ